MSELVVAHGLTDGSHPATLIASQPSDQPLVWTSEEHLTFALDAARMGMWEWDIQTGDTVFSPRAGTLVGLPASTAGVTIDQFMSLVHPEDLGLVADVRDRLASTTTDHEVVFRIVLPDQSVRWLMAKGRRIDYGRPRVVGIAMDITEQTRAEAELAAERDMLRALMDTLPDQIFIKDTGSRFVRLNAVTAPVLGVSDPTAAIGRTDADFFPPTLAERYRADEMRVLETGQPIINQLEPQDEGDQGRWVRTSKVPLRDADGQIIGLVGTNRDVTDQARAEQSLRQAEARFRTLVEHVPAIPYTRCLDATRSMTYIGPQIEALVGVPTDEFLARAGDLRQWIHVDDRQRVTDAQEQAIRTGQAFHDEYRLLTHDGREVWLRDDAVVVDDAADAAPHWQGVLLDITERKAADSALASSRHQLSLALRSADMTIWDWNFASDQIVTSVLQEPERLETMSYDEFLLRVHPDDRARVAEADQSAASSNGETDIEYRFIHGGQTRWVNDRGRFYVDSDGRPIGIAGVTVDVTARRAAENARRESERRYQAIVQNSSEIVMIVTLDGAILDLSPAFERILGYPPDLDEGKNVFSWVHPDDRAAIDQWFISSVNDPDPNETVEIRVRHQNGSWRWLEVSCSNLIDESSVGGIVVNARDVTVRKVAEANLREAETRYRTLVEQMPAITYVLPVAPHGAAPRPSYVSPQVQTLLGWTPEECLNDASGWLEKVHPDDREQFIAQDRRTTETGEPFDLEYRVRTKGGRYLWLHDWATIVRDDQGIAAYRQGIQLDVTTRKQLESELAHRAMHDPLTNLPNRTLFLDRLDSALRRGSRRRTTVAILFIDLDRFKLVNDSLGHAVGDQLLVEVGHRLVGSLRHEETLARLGGDEFAVLLETVNEATAVSVAERLIQALVPPFDLYGREAFVSASIGIALSAPHRITGTELLRAADVALYQAKDDSANHIVVFEDQMVLASSVRFAMESELRRALERQEFRLHFQPILSLVTDRVVAIESLLRWEHPERGLIGPAGFLSFAEETGAIVPIGEWVLDEACRQAVEIGARNGLDDLTVVVNLSARQLRAPNMIETIQRILTSYELAPHRLSLEITEHGLMEEGDATRVMIQNLTALGVRTAIDDFGTGYSSLAYLRHLAVSTLKIDQSFVQGMTDNPGTRPIVEAIAGLAHSLGLEVIAEGVETAEQLALVRDVGCDYVQGYFLSPPIPSEHIDSVLLDRSWASAASG